MSNLWIPGASAAPIEELVERLLRHIERFAREHGVERPHVEIELVDGSRFALDALSPEPGFGFLTIRPHKRDDDEPDELVVPVGSIRRIELARAAEAEAAFGFSLPAA